MSSSSKPLVSFLQRCVAVRQVTWRAGITARRGGVLSGRSGFTQGRAWTSLAGAAGPQRLCQPLSAARSSLGRFCTKPGAPCGDAYPPLPAYQANTEHKDQDVHIVQVKGIPWSCLAQDLLQFFSDCRIRDGVKGIHLIKDRLGRPAGQAFVEMEHGEDVRKALEKHRQYLGPRYVEVYEVTNSDAEVILKNAAQAPAEDAVVRLRGIPFTCTKADIVRFFSGLEIVENGIHIVINQRGKMSGDAFVQFSSQRAADEALQRDREVIGHRYIEVFPSTIDKMHSSMRIRSAAFPPPSPPPDPWRAAPASQPHPRAGPLQSSTLQPHFIHVRGLPHQVSGEDIVKFFSPLIVSKILLECRPDGRLSGEADVYFNCHQDATAAMSRDRECIGERYIELYLNSAPDSDRRCD